MIYARTPFRKLCSVYPSTFLLMSLMSFLLTGCGGGSTILVSKDGEGVVYGVANSSEVINCGGLCEYKSKKPFNVQLRAVPYEGATFVKWEGDANINGVCGSNLNCNLTVRDQDVYAIKAVFSGGEHREIQTCQGYLAQGIQRLYQSTANFSYRLAMRKFLCRVDWDEPSNHLLKNDVDSVFSMMFGYYDSYSIDDKIVKWQGKECSGLLVESGREDTFELKHAASLNVLQEYEQCQYDTVQSANMECSLEKESGKDNLIFTITPKGEGLTLTDFGIDTINATTLLPVEFRDYLTAYDNSDYGRFSVTLKPDDLFSDSEVVAYALSNAYGPFSCSAEVKGNKVNEYRLGGGISGLNGNITLADGNGYQITRGSNGNYRFSRRYETGDDYSVHIASKPSNQNCTVSNHTGTFGNSNVLNVNVSCNTIAERVRISSIGEVVFLPPHTNGDQEFAGNGPDVTANVTLQIYSSRTKLRAKIYMKARETKGDRTTAEGTMYKHIYTAPPGKIIKAIASGAVDSVEYEDDDRDWDYFTKGTSGPVNKFSFLGDTNGNDAGENTQVKILFNDILVDIL